MPGDAGARRGVRRDAEPAAPAATLFRKMVARDAPRGRAGDAAPGRRRSSRTRSAKARGEFADRSKTTGYSARTSSRAPSQGELDLSGIDDETFFDDAEEPLLAALRRFAESAAGAAGARRRLFAGDAAQGVALIDLVRTRFDVVLMNPPFGAASLAAKKEFEKAYPRTKNDIYAAFVERGIELLHPAGDARGDHLADRLLPVELPEVARGDHPEGGAAGRLRGPRLRRAGCGDGRGGRVLP